MGFCTVRPELTIVFGGGGVRTEGAPEDQGQVLVQIGGSMYGEVQCIMGNGYKGPPPL